MTEKMHLFSFNGKIENYRPGESIYSHSFPLYSWFNKGIESLPLDLYGEKTNTMVMTSIVIILSRVIMGLLNEIYFNVFKDQVVNWSKQWYLFFWVIYTNASDVTLFL